MANLLLLKNLLPDLYKVIGTPSRILIISPFKTPFGYIEAVVEEGDTTYIIENNDIPNQLELLGLDFALRRIRDFSMLPVKVEDMKILVEVPKENNHKDLITLAKYVDSFIKDLYDFVKNLMQLPEVKNRVGGVDSLIFKFEKLKEQEREKLKEKAERLKFEIVDLYDEIKSLLVEIERDIKGRKYIEANKKINEAIRKLGKLDSLRAEYKRITGKDFYSFYADILRSTLFGLKEEIEKE